LSTASPMSEREFAGDLMVFVDGYQQQDFRCIEINSGDDFFWSNGWAVGDNSRGRYCSRQSLDKIRRFKHFDDAVRYIETRRRKRPKERFFLVYVLGNTWLRVSSLDEILATDAVAAATNASAVGPSVRTRERNKLMDVGCSLGMANKVLYYLEVLREKGEAAADAGVSRATRMRYRSLLKEAGLTQ